MSKILICETSSEWKQPPSPCFPAPVSLLLMGLDRWPFWVTLGINLVWAVFVLATSFTYRQKAARRKLDLYLGVLVGSAIVSGAMALGQTWWNRDDGFWITYGMWAVTAVTIPLAAAHLASSISTHAKVAWKAFWAATPISLSMLFMALTPSRIGGNTEDALIMWTAVLYASLLANFIFWMLIVFRMIFVRRAHKNSAEPEDELQSNLVPRGLQIVAGILLMLAFICYALLVTLGPEGWHVYPGSPNHKNELQIKLYVFLGGIFFYQIAMGLIHYFVNVDGQNNMMPLAFLSREDATAYAAVDGAAAGGAGMSVSFSVNAGAVATPVGSQMHTVTAAPNASNYLF